MYKDKLIIGTANFGLDYGIKNKKKLKDEEIFDILQFAYTKDIFGIDTARAYGNAEQIIGKFFKQYGKVFSVITKITKKAYKSAKDVEDEICESLKNMNIDYIDFVLFHSYETYKCYGKVIIDVLSSLCKDKIIGQYGVSVYHPYEIEDITLTLKDVNLAIEFPLNIFDQRFLKKLNLRKFKDKGHFLFARSIFLQGLFFLDEKILINKFAKAKNKIRKLRQISKEYNIKTECIALLFTAEKSYIDGVIVGVDSKEQLMNNVTCFSKESLDKYKLIEPLLTELAIYDEKIILPYKWGIN
ncbi:MAG: aldo/keto reductase [candidate division WOR-3 bacterium]